MSTIEELEFAGDELTTAWAAAKRDLEKGLSPRDIAALERALNELGDTLSILEEWDDEIVLSAQEVL
jgi:hypothetical protein